MDAGSNYKGNETNPPKLCWDAARLQPEHNTSCGLQRVRKLNAAVPITLSLNYEHTSWPPPLAKATRRQPLITWSANTVGNVRKGSVGITTRLEKAARYPCKDKNRFGCLARRRLCCNGRC